MTSFWIKSFLALALLLPTSSFAINYAVFTCAPSYKTPHTLDVKLVWTRQLRDLKTSEFTDRGWSGLNVQMTVSPTTVGLVKATGQSDLEWERRGEHYFDNSGHSADGSFFSTKVIPEETITATLPPMSEKIPFESNDLFLYHFYVKVTDASLSAVSISLTHSEHSEYFRAHLMGYDKKGQKVPLVQTDFHCETKFVEDLSHQE